MSAARVVAEVAVLASALRERLVALAAASDIPVRLVAAPGERTFCVVCGARSELEASRSEFRYLVYSRPESGLSLEEVLAAGADRVFTEATDGAWSQLLHEVAAMWKRRRSECNYQLALEAVVQNMSEAVEITSPDVSILQVNPAFTALTGFEPHEAIGKSPGQFLRNDLNTPEFFESMERTWRAGEIWTGELLGKHRDGADTYSIATVIPVRGVDGELAHGVAIKQGVLLSSEEAAEAACSRAALSRTLASEARFRDMVDAAEDLIMVADMDTGQIIDANRASLDAFGYTLSELRRCTSRTLAPVSERKLMRRVTRDLLQTGRSRAQRIRLIRKDRSLFWGSVVLQVYESGGRSCQLAVIRDVSEDVAREEELEAAHQQVLHTARLAAIGRLAAGVAHEINNPATFIKSNLDVLRAHEKGDGEALSADERLEALEDALTGIGRIESVAQQLVAFARTPRAVMKQVCANEVLELALRMTANEIRHRAELTRDLAEGLPFVQIDENRLGQVLTNILVNAAHAIPEGASEKQTIAVSTSLEDEQVVVRVRDTGVGMPEHVRKRALEPFFTTKQPGRGTGLGLALCVDILAAHGGTLSIASEEGVGTTVEVRLLCEEAVVGGASCDTAVAPSQPSGQSRILFIDDEKLVLRVYRRWMRNQHDVVLASGGREALDILADDQNFDMIVCDVMMPNVDGPGVYTELREKFPKLAERVVFCTGGAFTERSGAFLRTFDGIVLNKPVERDDVISALSSLQEKLAS